VIVKQFGPGYRKKFSFFLSHALALKSWVPRGISGNQVSTWSFRLESNLAQDAEKNLVFF